jgi:DNA repair exonuclease SbcCD ATPase subunit
MAAVISEKDKVAFLALTRKPYVDQAKWFLNGMWASCEKEAEPVFKFTMKFIELDPKKKAGNELDEFLAHKFLESLGETLTVVELRAKLRKIDLDANGKMALLEYLAFRYEKSVGAIANAAQGGSPENQREIDAAAKMLDELMSALADLQAKVASLSKAEAELKAAVDALHKQQDAYDKEAKRLEEKSKNMTFSVVLRNKAANELAQMKQKDPLPLNRAKLTQAAALKRVEKERKETEAAQADTQKKADAASAALDELKKKGGTAFGSLWFMEREVHEAKKFLPQSKGGIRK